MRAVVLGALASAAVLAAGAAGAQAPGGGLIAPGSGFANGPSPAFRGGAIQAPGSGFPPSSAGTLDASPRVTGSVPLNGIGVPGGDGVARGEVTGLPQRHHGRVKAPRRRYTPSYPDVPDIIAPDD